MQERKKKGQEEAQPEKQSITFYSDYGYVQVLKEEFENSENYLVNISKDKKELYGKIKRANLTREIKVNLKTLYGDRKMYTYHVQIDDKISSLVKHLVEDEEKLDEKDPKKKWNKNYQYRLISPVGTIRDLTPSGKFQDENIKNGYTLILASPIKLHFSETQHGPGILIENNNSTAYKQTGDEHQYALANKGFSSGVNYCEFTLETEPDERNVIIGVTLNRNDYYFNADSKNFWGFVPSDCKKMFHENGTVKNEDYGDICKIGDKIGLLMEFKQTGVDISFYINKLDLGIAFRGLPVGTYYPCVLLYYDGAKVKITNRIPLPDNIKD